MINIRPIKSEDVERCLEIYNYYIENTTVTFEEEPLGVSEFRERIKRISEKYPFLVAEEDGNVLGYVYLDEFNPRSAYRFTADLSVYLDAKAQKRGVGTFLLKAVEEKGKELGLRNIVSLITSENEKSVRFHEKNGFELKGKLENVGVKFQKTLSVFYYQKSI